MSSTSPRADAPPPPAPDRALIVPGDLGGPSGGSLYNAHLLEALRADGLAIAETAVPGPWPRPRPEDLEALAAALHSAPDVLVDGIVACAAPDEIADAVADGIRISILVHLPLPAETGLGDDEAADLARRERAAVTVADAVVCTSAWARDDLRRRYGVEAAVVAPGVTAAPIAAGSIPPRMLILGSLTPRKNAVGALEALLPLTDLAWSVSVAGPRHADPGYAGQVDRAAGDLGPGRADVTGAVTGDDLERLWRRVDLLLLPSLTETYGMVVTEALARGIPALVPSGTGAVEALSAGRGPDGLPGAVLDPRDPEAWSALLARWLADPELRDAWRSRARLARSRLRTWPDAAKELRAALAW
jgi:glycosyltransferase involved in cell wall biosynthesis